MKQIKFTLLSLVFIFSVGCGQVFKAKNELSPAESIASETDYMGSGEYRTNALNQVNVKNIDDMTDDEILQNHIKMLESLLELIKNQDESMIPEGAEIDKDQLIKDLEARIEKLKTDEEFAQEVVDRIRAIIKEIEEKRASGELPDPDDLPVNCERLKEIIESGDLPEGLQKLEEERYEKRCSES